MTLLNLPGEEDLVMESHNCRILKHHDLVLLHNNLKIFF